MDWSRIKLPPTADMHVHLRDGEMMRTVTPLIRSGGVDTVYVMPNLQPPITTVEQALAYRERLQVLAPSVTFLISLYLHPDITPETIAKAKKAGITGVKVYPSGVTTNSESGVVDLESFYAVFSAMEQEDMILNLHGETSTPALDQAEKEFLPTLLKLHKSFPRLRIILEHCTTADALDAVRSCNSDKVAATITAHHLYLTNEDWHEDAGNDSFCFCKPVAKTSRDRDALLKAACSGEEMFFFGSDSAPHPVTSKTAPNRAAGVFTQPYATQLVLSALEDAIAKGTISPNNVSEEKLARFLTHNGRRFYGLLQVGGKETIVLEKKGEVVSETIKSKDGSIEVKNSRSGREIHSLSWI